MFYPEHISSDHNLPLPTIEFFGQVEGKKEDQLWFDDDNALIMTTMTTMIIFYDLVAECSDLDNMTTVTTMMLSSMITTTIILVVITFI